MKPPLCIVPHKTGKPARKPVYTIHRILLCNSDDNSDFRNLDFQKLKSSPLSVQHIRNLPRFVRQNDSTFHENIVKFFSLYLNVKGVSRVILSIIQ